MTYKLFILPGAQKQLEKIPARDYKRVKKSILSLARNPRPSGVKKLKGRQAWRIRQGDYRIIYEIRDKVLTVTVIALGHRKDIYK
ncbi:MAG: type II toxin-antitoxin system RelE family toxin, partial [Bacteroidales bacterium]